MNFQDKLIIKNKFNNHRVVVIKYSPSKGKATAIYGDEEIVQRQHVKLSPPTTDDESEWSQWEIDFDTWKDEILQILEPLCEHFFNKFKPVLHETYISEFYHS